jgi:hypothetical protein
VVRTALLNVKEMETDYALRVGEQRCEEMCRTLQDLLDDLTKKISQHPLRTKGSGQMEKKGR